MPGASTLWSLTSVRYKNGGRIPEIITEESGRVIMQSDRSIWEAAEAMHDILRMQLGR